MNNQIGIQNSNKEPANMPPVTKLLQARYARMTRIEPLQMISNVFMQAIYNEIAKTNMGIIPSPDHRVSRTLKQLICGVTAQLVNRIRLPNFDRNCR
jgi:hypothetical protein